MSNPLNDGLNKPDQLAPGISYQSGSVEPTAATAKVVVFDTPFPTVPSVNLTVSESGTGNAAITFKGTGSFGFLGTSGISYDWQALL
jgi:hypothetical protein